MKREIWKTRDTQPTHVGLIIEERAVLWKTIPTFIHNNHSHM